MQALSSSSCICATCSQACNASSTRVTSVHDIAFPYTYEHVFTLLQLVMTTHVLKVHVWFSKFVHQYCLHSYSKCSTLSNRPYFMLDIISLTWALWHILLIYYHAIGQHKRIGTRDGNTLLFVVCGCVRFQSMLVSHACLLFFPTRHELD